MQHHIIHIRVKMVLIHYLITMKLMEAEVEELLHGKVKIYQDAMVRVAALGVGVVIIMAMLVQHRKTIYPRV